MVTRFCHSMGDDLQPMLSIPEEVRETRLALMHRLVAAVDKEKPSANMWEQ